MELTVKEKAKELYYKFTIYAPLHIYNKQCALIAVDELIIQNGELYLFGLDSEYYREKNNYLFEVKKEIEKL